MSSEATPAAPRGGTTDSRTGARTSVLDQVDGGWRALAEEFVGTMLLVMLAVGTAT